MHLLDANVMIRADADFYPLDRIPQFWEWLIAQGENGDVKIPAEILDEIVAGTGALADWVADKAVKAALLLDETPDPALVQKALDDGYQAQDAGFNDSELLKIGSDAFLVAYGLVHEERIIVTREVPKRTKRLGASKLPDVCDDCGVKWTTDYEMYRLLDFNLSGR